MNTYTLSEAAKKLGLKFGRNTLYKILKERNIIDNNNRPFPKYIEDGYLSYHVKYIKGLRKDQSVTL